MIALGIDCGTQSLKVLLLDTESGDTYAATRGYGLIDGLPPGHKEQDPSVWIEALESCIQELTQTIGKLSVVEAIGISGQQHGLVVLDSADRVLRAAKLWNDTSTEQQCREILDAAGGLENYRAETGNSLPPGFTASKILWIRQREPEVYERIASLLLPHDYLNLFLTGEKVAEPGDASGTGYFNVRERTWSRRALQWIDPERDLFPLLPRLIESGKPAGFLRSELAARWGMGSEVIVSSGGGDNMMGAVGSGNVSPNILTLSLGTSGTLYGYSEEPIVDPEGEIAAFCDSTGGWLPLGCTMNVTVATEMVRHSILSVDHEGFDQSLQSVGPGSDGLVLLPYLEGERMPHVPNGTGVLVGLRPDTCTKDHLARAVTEGVTFGLRYGLERLRELGMKYQEIRLTGGGARSPVWRQLAADIMDLPVVCPENKEGPAFGAAIQALWCQSESEISELAAHHVRLDEETRCEPDAATRAVYDEVYGLYKELSVNLISGEVFPRHRKLLEAWSQ